MTNDQALITSDEQLDALEDRMLHTGYGDAVGDLKEIALGMIGAIRSLKGSPSTMQENRRRQRRATGFDAKFGEDFRALFSQIQEKSAFTSHDLRLLLMVNIRILEILEAVYPIKSGLLEPYRPDEG